MTKIKDIPKVDRPREKFLEKGADALSKSELLAMLLGSGIKGKNVKQLSEQIVRKFGDKFLTMTVESLLEIPGIGHAKALLLFQSDRSLEKVTDTKSIIFELKLDELRKLAVEKGVKLEVQYTTIM